MIIWPLVEQMRLLQILAAAEPVGLQDVRYAAIETLDHAVGYGCPWLGQPVLYAGCLAPLVKLMVVTGFALSECKHTVGEFFAIVGQQFLDSDWAGLVGVVTENGKQSTLRLMGLHRLILGQEPCDR